MDRDKESLGLFVSTSLDSLGYGEGIVEFRTRTQLGIKQYYNDALCNSGFESDIDQSSSEVSFLKKNVVCFSRSEVRLGIQRNVISFESERSLSPPGFTRLVLVNGLASLSNDDDILNSTFGKEKKYLWSICYFNKMKYKFSRSIKMRQVIGPSMCARKSDLKFPLRYYDRELHAQMRSKLSRWPVGCQVQDVSHMEGFVVPDFSSESENSHLEWRISYTCVEQMLFQSLNITQVKLYILLQMIAESTLQHISSDINSYVMKNILFWMIHVYPLDIFQERHLILLLLTALGMLYNGINSSFIPCYITENRNLLSTHMDVPRKHDVLKMLSILQQEKACMLLRCEKLKCVMLMKFRSPHIIDIYQKQRDKLEKMMLILDFIQGKYAASAHDMKDFCQLISTDKDWIRVAKAVYDLVLPGWVEHYIKGEHAADIVVSRIREILI